MKSANVRGWVFLAVTVALEVVGTLCLRASQGFTVLAPSVVSVTSYAATVVVLSLALKTIPMSLAYVVWTGAGTTGIVALSIVFFDDVMTAASWTGIVLVVVGVMMINAGPTGRRSTGGQSQEHSQ